MRKILSLAALATAVVPAMAAVSAPSVASAQGYRPGYFSNPCGPAQKNARVSGAAIGGVVGAVIGNRVASRGVRTEGTVLGAVAGAAVGQEIGRRQGCKAAAQYGYGQRYGYEPRNSQRYGYGNGYGYRR